MTKQHSLASHQPTCSLPSLPCFQSLKFVTCISKFQRISFPEAIHTSLVMCTHQAAQVPGQHVCLATVSNALDAHSWNWIETWSTRITHSLQTFPAFRTRQRYHYEHLLHGRAVRVRNRGRAKRHVHSQGRRTIPDPARIAACSRPRTCAARPVSPQVVFITEDAETCLLEAIEYRVSAQGRTPLTCEGSGTSDQLLTRSQTKSGSSAGGRSMRA